MDGPKSKQEGHPPRHRGVSSNPRNMRHVSDSASPEDRRPSLSSWDRNFSTNNIMRGSVVPGFGTHAENPPPPAATASSPTFSSMMASPMHASWSIGDGDFLGDEYIGPSANRIGPGSLHSSIVGAQSISLRNMSQLSGDDPSMIRDAARIANWRTVLALCRTNPEGARYTGQDGWTALHHACNRRCPNAEVAEALIRAYPDALLQMESQGGKTPLHFACRFKAPKDVVRLLLHMYPGRGHAAVAKRDRKGRTPLYYAVRYDAPEGVVEMLLEVDPSVVLDEDRNADSPLAVVWDSWAEKFDGKKVLHPFLHPEKTLESEADRSHFLQEKLRSLPKLFKKWNTVNLFLRAAFRFPSIDEDPITAMLRENDEEGGGDIETERKWRVLHATAAIKCHPTLFMLAMALSPEQASELDENDLYGSGDSSKEKNRSTHQTALHLAASSPANGEGGRAVIDALLSSYPGGAQVADGTDGSLPLHRIVENERKSHWVFDGVRDVFMAYPMALHTPDNLGRLPLHRAAVVSHHDGAVKTTPAEVGSVICNLVEANPEAASKADNSGRLPLHVIAEHGEVWDEQAEAVLNAHPAAARTRAGPHFYNRLPIHLAAASPDARRSLIEHLVELHPRGVSQTDRLGKLPLHLACESGKTWDNGVGAIYDADPNAIREAEGNSRRWFALHMAAACPNAGADLIDSLTDVYRHAANETDTSGRYPLHLACASGKGWEDGLRSLFEANPDAILAWDQSGMLPFHVAAICYCSSSSGGGGSSEPDPDEDHDDWDRSISIRASVSEDHQQDSVSEGNHVEISKTDMLFHLLRAEPSVLSLI